MLKLFFTFVSTKTVKDMTKEIFTVSGKRFHCKHKTGWFKTIRIKKWWFEVSAKYFLCLECEDLIPIDEYENVQSSEEKQTDV